MFSKNISNNELKFTPTFGTQLGMIIANAGLHVKINDLQRTNLQTWKLKSHITNAGYKLNQFGASQQ